MAKPKPAANQTLVILVAKTPVRHDDVDYLPGDPLDVTESQAAALIAVGAARLPDAPAATQEEK